ncbi:MAG: thioredoxin-like domain-containing protein [Acidimicrobiales bacterium]
MPDAAPAPELGGVGGWIGVSRPLSMAALRGRVVLVAFWAASDVASYQLLEDLRPLEDTFADQLVVVGVHSPRFPHEAEHDAVLAAVARHAVAHAVVDDADHRVWEAYGIEEWPTVVVVGPTGEIFGYVSGKGCGAALEKVVAEVLEAVPAGAGRRRRRLPAVERALLPPGPLAFPGKVAASADGRRLAVADTAHDRVLVCSLEGVVLEAHTGYLQPQGVRFDGASVVICDTGADRLVRTGGEVLADAVASPWDVAADGASWLIAEAGGHRVLRLRPGELRARLVAGTGQEGGTDGPVQKATLSQPSGVTRIPAGVVVADAGASSLRLVTDGAVAEVSTVAGGGPLECGDADGGPDRGRLQFPLGVAADPAGGPVYVADTYNSALRVWDGSTLRTLPVAGLDQPGGLDLLPDGRLVVADTGNHRIVVVDPGSGRLEPVELDETWVHGDDGPPVRLPLGRGAEVPFHIHLVDEELDVSEEGAPVEVSVEARPAALLAGGPVRLRLDRPSGVVEVRGGSPGAGLLLVEVTARTSGAGGAATRVHRRRHELQVASG